jgi:hypothetical protein
MKILLGDFNAKVGREDIFKPTNGNESLHEISNDNGVKVVNFATSKNLRRPLGRPRCRWADNIKMDLTRDWMGWNRLDRSGSG